MINGGKFWFGMALSVALITLFLLTVDLDRMVNALTEAKYQYLIPGIGSYMISILFRTLRWGVLLSHLSNVKTSRLYPVVVVGYMANNLLPLRLGELVRSYYVGEREGLSKTSALATIMVERVLDALTLLFFIVTIALFVPLSGLGNSLAEWSGIPWPLLATACSVPFVVAFCLMLLFALYPNQTWAGTIVVLRILPKRWNIGGWWQRGQEIGPDIIVREKVREFIRMFLDGFIPLRSPKTLVLIFSLSMPVWLFESLLFFFVGFSFGLDGVFDNLGQLAAMSVLVTAIANIGSSVPGAPGGIGLFELLARETLVLVPLATIDRSVAAGFATVVHVSLLLPMILLGQMFLWVEHVSLRNLSRAGQQITPESPIAQRQNAMPPTTTDMDREDLD